MLEKILREIEKVIPRKIYKFFQPAYHFLLAYIGAIRYRFPGRHINVIGVTGTKGKSSTTEFVNAVLESAGYKTALLSTIKFKLGDESKPNKYKMTMPGRFFVQKFLHDAVKKKCDFAIIEMTSEGAKFFRHTGIDMDTLLFTNLSPEHIESHGSFKNYLNAKLRLAKALSKSHKSKRTVIANIDNEYGHHFMIYDVEKNIPYSLSDVEIKEETIKSSVISYKDTEFKIPLPGKFNILNALSAIKLGENEGISLELIKKGIEGLALIRGRVESINEGQLFDVIVDYAHTDDSLRKLYEAFPSKKKICVLGATGGGRDKWKRPVMGEIADTYCNEIILTNEDPYDESPEQIVDDIKKGIKTHKPLIIMDRRKAMHKAFTIASAGDVVLITGKGTDPYIMEEKGKRTPWDDATVAREELKKIK